MAGESTAARARLLGISRSSLYYKPKKLPQDWKLKQRIEEVLRENPSYGSRRVAEVLDLNRKGVQRVMRRFGIKAYRRRGRKWRRKKAISIRYPNLLATTVLNRPDHIWVADFTRIPFQGKVMYLSTVMDIYTREIVGAEVQTTHALPLVLGSLWHALLTRPRPEIFHSDNGSEYDSKVFVSMLCDTGVKISRSTPSCPWENGYQESFYSQFKVDLGDPGRFETLGEVTAEIYRLLHYYNTRRIHSALRMAPVQFMQKLLAA